MPFLGKAIASFQLLIRIPPSVAGFDYSWQPYNEAAKIGSKEWNPVHIGFAAPCVLVIDQEGHEYLGRLVFLLFFHQLGSNAVRKTRCL